MVIIALFLRRDPFVMLDDPTNHLDVDKRSLLCRYLKQKKGFILVTHDYEFLDQVADHVLAINKADITLEQGNYSTWKRNMLQKISLLWRPELRNILIGEKLPKYSGKNKKYIAKVLADKIPEEKLDRLISEELFQRDYTVFDDED